MPSAIQQAKGSILSGVGPALQKGIETLTSTEVPVHFASASGVLIGNDNWRKSFFYRSFQHKTPRSASIAVVQYNTSGELVSVPDFPEEHRFIVTTSSMSYAENVQILQTFGEDKDILQTFGSRPQIWQLQGVLRNEQRETNLTTVFQEDGSSEVVFSGDGDWANGLVDAYESHLRASQLVRRGQFLEFRISDKLIHGYLLSLNLQESAQNDLMIPFSMDFFVRAVKVPGLIEANRATTKLESTDPK